jgi:hypothetical protein
VSISPTCLFAFPVPAPTSLLLFDLWFSTPCGGHTAPARRKLSFDHLARVDMDERGRTYSLASANHMTDMCTCLVRAPRLGSDLAFGFGFGYAACPEHRFVAVLFFPPSEPQLLALSLRSCHLTFPSRSVLKLRCYIPMMNPARRCIPAYTTTRTWHLLERINILALRGEQRSLLSVRKDSYFQSNGWSVLLYAHDEGITITCSRQLRVSAL